MPRTRSQAVESPLVSLETPPRRKKRVTVTRKPSTDDQEPAVITTAAKPKRGRKPLNKKPIAENSSEEKVETQSEINDSPISQNQDSQDFADTKADAPMADPIPEAAPDNVEISPTAPRKKELDLDKFSTTSQELSSSIFSSEKKHTIRRALGSVQAAFKRSAQSIRGRLRSLKDSRSIQGLQSEAVEEASFANNYSLAEDEILDAALEILLHRMENYPCQNPPTSIIRCPCCHEGLLINCPNNHDLQSWVSDEVKEGLSAVLTTVLTEGHLATSIHKDDLLRQAEKHNTQSEERQKPAPKKKKAALSSKQKSKKRARDPDDDLADVETPTAQRPRLIKSAGQIPYNRNRATPRRKRTFAEARRRAAELEYGSALPSTIGANNMMQQHETQRSAEEADEVARFEAISQTAMEHRAILGEVPKDIQDSFDVPVLDDDPRDSDMVQSLEIVEAVQAPFPTPNSNRWGFDIRGFFNSVTGSVKRFVPNFGHSTDLAVPFVAGGGATPTIAVNGDLNGETSTTAKRRSLTFSFYPQPVPATSEPGPGNAVDHTPDESQSITEKSSTDKINNADAQTIQKIADKAIEPEENNQLRKRKRPPSPEQIPNPPGCSYGMNLDYFDYSDEEYEEMLAEHKAGQAAEHIQVTPSPSILGTSAAELSEKRARIEPSTTSTRWEAPIPPGWSRPTTTVYTGETFKGMRFPTQAPLPSSFETQRIREIKFRATMEEAELPPCETYPSTGSILDLPKNRSSKRSLAKLDPFWKTKNSSVNTSLGTQGRFQPTSLSAAKPLASPSKPLESSKQVSASPTFPVQSALPQQTVAMNTLENGILSQLPQEHLDTHAKNAISTTPITSTESAPPVVHPLPLASKGRPLTDVHKPNNPSRLRNAMRLSSSPIPQSSPPSNVVEPLQQDLMQAFGDDVHGRQAYDAYTSCPSGDFNQVHWPSFECLPNSTLFEENQHRFGNGTFRGSFAQFQNDFTQGLVDPNEILNDLPL